MASVAAAAGPARAARLRQAREWWEYYAISLPRIGVNLLYCQRTARSTASAQSR